MAVSRGVRRPYPELVSGFLRGTPDGRRRLALSRDRAVDVAMAAVVTVFNVVGAVSPDPAVAYDLGTGHPMSVAVSALAGVAVLARRTHPLAVFVLVTVVTTVVHLGHWQNGFLPVTLVLAAYALGAFGTAVAGAVGLALFTVCVGLLFATSAPYFDSPIGLQAFAQVGAAGLLGAAVARRRTAADLAAARAAQSAKEAGRAAERAVLAERLRVARELNAAVSDAMTAITVQAAAARHDGDQGGVLATIERSGRAATEDLRRLLRTLRQPGSRAEPPGAAAASSARSWRSDALPVDLTLGGCVALFNVLGSALPDPSAAPEYGEPVPAGLIALVALPGLALVVRRRYPVAVLAVALVVLATVGSLGGQTGSLPGTVLIAAYALGAWAPVRQGLAALAAMWTTMVVVDAADLMPPDFEEEGSVLGALVIFTLPWVAGMVIRRRRLADQAQVAEALAAEREHAAAIERALAEERLAVARDLHDLVSHSLAAITVQAASARRRGEPEGTTLEVIERTGRAALTDLRQMLDALRTRGGQPGPPAPGLPEIEELVAQHRARHGPVELLIDPALEQEPGSLRTTSYRVVQESLTNVARHAPGSPAVVTLTASDRGVRVEVENQPVQPGSVTTPGSGWGLAGMRERVALVGGTLDAAETSDGGFAVHAELDRRADQ